MLYAMAVASVCATFMPGTTPETNPAMRARFAEVLAVSGTTHPVELCRMPYDRRRPSAGSQEIREENGRIAVAVVYVSDLFRRGMSPAALSGIYAHELAHFVTPTVVEVPYWRVATLGERLANESPVDVQAAQWVGRDALVAALQEAFLLSGNRRQGRRRQDYMLEMIVRELKVKGW